MKAERTQLQETFIVEYNNKEYSVVKTLWDINGYIEYEVFDEEGDEVDDTLHSLILEAMEE